MGQKLSWRDHKARKQVKECDLPSGVPPQTGLVFNQWYNKWSHGSSSTNNTSSFVSPYRLDIERDQGYTLAKNDSWFCLFFAKGCCTLGHKCQYFHHIPDSSTDSSITPAKDCFGRDKFAQNRDDMGGVGTFNGNRTLYVGGITNALNGKTLKPIQIENRLKFLFQPLGSLESIRYLELKNCAFVKFRDSMNAEFAKECMSNQSLLLPNDKEWDRRMDGAGLLVKWAREDPDPRTKRQNETEKHERSIQLMKRLLDEQSSKTTSSPPKKKQNVTKKAAPVVVPTGLVADYDSSSSDED